MRDAMRNSGDSMVEAVEVVVVVAAVAALNRHRERTTLATTYITIIGCLIHVFIFSSVLSLGRKDRERFLLRCDDARFIGFGSFGDLKGVSFYSSPVPIPRE